MYTVYGLVKYADILDECTPSRGLKNKPSMEVGKQQDSSRESQAWVIVISWPLVQSHITKFRFCNTQHKLHDL